MLIEGRSLRVTQKKPWKIFLSESFFFIMKARNALKTLWFFKFLTGDSPSGLFSNDAALSHRETEKVINATGGLSTSFFFSVQRAHSRTMID